ncbi:hypothetical protein [Amniculibacterium sp. G2-70]|jgi:hypothetical protein|uniref:hypothetical protein n=1 Tax=Amniculibacterium sp. G2-70 TaxID=2767188 RepID=UPI001653F3D5|nr:hypothetical protein [Amniculibacterium sp. G2-70]
MKRTSILILGAVALLTSSCASIVSKSSWPIAINSTPSEAKISITDKKGVEIYNGYTPANIKLKSGSGFFSKARYQIKFTKDGYESKTVPVEFKLNGWYFGNILFGGFIGLLIVDPATGAMYRAENDAFNETLLKNANIGAVDKPSLKLIDINDLSKDQKEKLVKL